MGKTKDVTEHIRSMIVRVNGSDELHLNPSLHESWMRGFLWTSHLNSEYSKLHDYLSIKFSYGGDEVQEIATRSVSKGGRPIYAVHITPSYVSCEPDRYKGSSESQDFDGKKEVKDTTGWYICFNFPFCCVCNGCGYVTPTGPDSFQKAACCILPCPGMPMYQHARRIPGSNTFINFDDLEKKEIHLFRGEINDDISYWWKCGLHLISR